MKLPFGIKEITLLNSGLILIGFMLGMGYIPVGTYPLVGKVAGWLIVAASGLFLFKRKKE